MLKTSSQVSIPIPHASSFEAFSPHFQPDVSTTTTSLRAGTLHAPLRLPPRSSPSVSRPHLCRARSVRQRAREVREPCAVRIPCLRRPFSKETRGSRHRILAQTGCPQGLQCPTQP